MGMKPKASFKSWAFVAVDPFEDLLLGPTFGTAKVSETHTAPFCCVVVVVVAVVVVVVIFRLCAITPLWKGEFLRLFFVVHLFYGL